MMRKMNRKREADIFLHRFIVGPLEVNCYLLADSVTGKSCLIDPGADPDNIKKFLAKNNFKPEFIINTHGHGDHIAANGSFGIPIYIHDLDRDFLTDPDMNLSRMFIFSVVSPKASRLLKDGDVVELGSTRLDIIHTPGHTPGSISIKAANIIFTGDALFAGSIGRTDFSYGDQNLLMNSIEKKLMVFDDDTIIYPGHGERSTIGEERRNNPFLV